MYRTRRYIVFVAYDVSLREGSDGPWSSFSVSIGTPAQEVSVLISTGDDQLSFILPDDCSPDNPSACKGSCK